MHLKSFVGRPASNRSNRNGHVKSSKPATRTLDVEPGLLDSEQACSQAVLVMVQGLLLQALIGNNGSTT